MIRALPFVLLASLAVVGCSSADDTSPVTPKKDTGVKDSASTDDSSTTDDGVEDTGMVTTDGTVTETAMETGPSTCAKPDDHPGDECDMVKQNCADVASTCEYDPSASHNVCAKRATGSATKGEACASSSDCDKGLFCYSKHCSPACCTGDNSVCGGTGGSCDIAVTDPGSMAVIYHVCSYSAKCNPFKYDCPTGEVCLFSEAPDAFKCSAPASGSAGLSAKPGIPCKYVNDCGESQLCTALTMGDAAAGASQCYLFCWLTPPSGFTPGTTPGGRFAADGDCNVGGTSYGTCTAIGGIGGGLGLCVK
jgi:hypothetical protein